MVYLAHRNENRQAVILVSPWNFFSSLMSIFILLPYCPLGRFNELPFRTPRKVIMPNSLTLSTEMHWNLTCRYLTAAWVSFSFKKIESFTGCRSRWSGKFTHSFIMGYFNWYSLRLPSCTVPFKGTLFHILSRDKKIISPKVLP